MATVDPAHPTGPGAPASEPLPPLVSPMPRSKVLDREEPEFVDEPDLPAPSSPEPKPPEQSAAGEEDPGAAVDSI